MANKTKKDAIGNVSVENLQVVEKLRDELFEYRVDIHSYKRSMNILWACVSVVIAILGFFGFDRVEALLDRVEQNANERLAQTDMLLSKVDTHYLDSLTAIVQERTQAYQDAIAALEKGTRVNNELYKKLISGLPYNKRIEGKRSPYIQKEATNLFDVVFYTEKYSYNQTGECYVVMGEEYRLEKDDFISVEIRPRNRHVIIFEQSYEVFSNYNKFHFQFEEFEGYSDYDLSIILFRKNGKEIYGYQLSKPISVK